MSGHNRTRSPPPPPTPPPPSVRHSAVAAQGHVDDDDDGKMPSEASFRQRLTRVGLDGAEQRVTFDELQNCNSVWLNTVLEGLPLGSQDLTRKLLKKLVVEEGELWDAKEGIPESVLTDWASVSAWLLSDIHDNKFDKSEFVIERVTLWRSLVPAYGDLPRMQRVKKTARAWVALCRALMFVLSIKE